MGGWQQRNLPSPVCVCHKHPLAGSSQANLSNTFVFAFEDLRLPLRFVLTLAFSEAGGAQFAVEFTKSKQEWSKLILQQKKMFIQSNDGSVYFVLWGKRVCAMSCVCLKSNGNC